MSESPQQPTKSARAADALEAMFRGEQVSPDAPPQTIDGVQIGAASSGVALPDQIRADSAGRPPLPGAMGYSDAMTPAFTTPTGQPGARRRRNAMSQSWRYAIPVLAGMAALMFALALVSVAMLLGWWGSRQSPFMVVLMLVACLLFGLFFVFSCYVIRSELRRQEQNRNRAAQRTNPPAAE